MIEHLNGALVLALLQILAGLVILLASRGLMYWTAAKLDARARKLEKRRKVERMVRTEVRERLEAQTGI